MVGPPYCFPINPFFVALACVYCMRCMLYLALPCLALPGGLTEELSQRGGSGAFANRFASIGFVQEEGWLRRLLSHLAGRFVARFQWWARYSSESLTFFAAFLSAIVQHCGNCALFLFRSEAIYFLAKARNHIF